MSTILKTVQLPDARRIVAAAQAEAAEAKVAVCVAVVDQAGHLLAFERMEGAPLSSIDGALRKARTASMFAWDTADLSSRPRFDVDMAAWNDPHALFAPGGVVLRQDGVAVGGVGVCGGPGAHDQEIAKAAAEAF